MFDPGQFVERTAAFEPSQKREVLPVGALSNADLEAIGRTEVAARHQHLDLELK